MPKLNCGVENCAYNAERCCCLGNINVDGSNNTEHTEGTCCNSFTEDSGAHNCSGVPAVDSEVDCQATNCTHNDNCKSHADSIEVVGNGACRCGETECSSFCKE